MLKSIFDRLIDVLYGVSGFLIVLLMIEVSTDVVLRYFFNRPISWTIEFSQYAMTFILYLGTARVLRNGGHVEVDVLTSRLSDKARELTNGITSIITALVCFIITWFGIRVNVDYYQTNYMFGDVLSVPAFLLQGVVPLGTFLLTIQFLRRACKCLRKWKTP